MDFYANESTMEGLRVSKTGDGLFQLASVDSRGGVKLVREKTKTASLREWGRPCYRLWCGASWSNV